MTFTSLFDADDSDEDEIQVSLSADPAYSASQERSERAQVILDEIGEISLDIRNQVYTNAVEFVSDMQDRLEDSRARKTFFWVSERQLEWLEAIYDKVS